MNSSETVSIRTLAKLCNVSTATISRVLNHNDKVSPETRDKVLKIIEEHHYTLPVSKAAKPSPKSQGCIGVLLESSQSDYYLSLQRHIVLYFMNLGINVLHYNIEDQEKFESAALKTLYKSNIDGLILISVHSNDINQILNPNIPTVWIDCNDICMNDPDSLWVTSDHYIGGKLAAQEFINKKCKHPIILTNATPTLRAASRIKGFSDTFEKYGVLIEDNQIVQMPGIVNPFQESKDMVQYMFMKGIPFDSIFAINDWRALGCMAGIEALGLRVPDDIKIIGFDGISLASNSVQRITSIRQNTELIAQNACRLLMQQIKHTEILHRHIGVPTTLIEGSTT